MYVFNLHWSFVFFTASVYISEASPMNRVSMDVRKIPFFLKMKLLGRINKTIYHLSVLYQT